MFESYLNRVTHQGKTSGQIHKTEADDIMNDTWWEDPQSRVGYLYDYYHDSEIDKLTGLHSDEDILKTAVDIKFIVTGHSSLSNSQIEYYIMFRPGQERLLDYYDDSICHVGADYPTGMYIDIPDQDEIINRWLIVGSDDGTNQFKRYRIMKCNHYLHWVWNNNLYDMCVVLRYRNSYNSGVWSDYLTTTVQNQNLMMFPHNDITQHLYYNQRFIVDSRSNTPGLDSYLTWETSKVETKFPDGIIQLTLNQGLFNPKTDLFDPNTGFLYADYASGGDLQTHHTDDNDGEYSKIILIGSHTVRVAGTGLNLKLKFYNKSDEEIQKVISTDAISNVWSAVITNRDGTPYSGEEIPIDKIVSSIDGDMTNVTLHIDERINLYEDVFVEGYTLIGKVINLHGHFEDGSCDSEIDIAVRSL